MHRILFLFLTVFFIASAEAAEVRSPEEYLGFPIGADRKLADYNEVMGYLDELAAGSPWVETETIGTTTLGRPFIMAVLSTPDNLSNLSRYKEISRKLADPRGLPAGEAEQLIKEGKTFVLITCNLHSTEIASAQAALELAYEIASGENDMARNALEETVLFLIPSLNPDGLQMVVDWYEKWVGTEYEGCEMPWLYHHYVGHDNNRDWFMVNLAETRAVFEVYFDTVIPHVVLDMHQMWSTGARLFLPQFYPPANVNVDPILYREIGLLGYAMQLECEERDLAGVISDAYFTAYWEGTSMMTPWWHNQVGLLSEAASCRVATPVYIDEVELEGGSKGFPRYEHRINFPNPWPGGWWRLRDIVDYELAIADGLLDCCARHNERFLRNFYAMGARAVAQGKNEPPYGFVIPAPQDDPVTAARMIEAFMLGGVEVHEAVKDFMIGNRLYRAGSYVIRLDQPYRAYAKDLLEVQEYPDIRASEKEDFVRPYDVTGWTLPMQMGIACEEIDEPFEAELRLLENYPYAEHALPRENENIWGFALDPRINASYAAAFALLENGHTVLRADEELALGEDALPAGALLVQSRKGLTDDARALSRDLHAIFHPVTGESAAAARRLKPVKTALFKPWRASMDEGWTRYLFDTHLVPYENVTNEQIKEGEIGDYDALVLADISPDIIKKGEWTGEYARFSRPMPPDYEGGIEDEGVENIKKFVAGGGTLICFGRSCDFAIEALELPVRNVLEKAGPDDFYAPGSILEVAFREGHPVTYGMAGKGHVFFTNSPAFATSLPFGKFDRSILAAYEKKNPLASGLLIGPERLYRRAALVEMTYDRGKVLLFGFRPQHRCQTAGTYKLIFNALLESGRK
ncbi:MAG TPA: hypothetical protein ENO08_00030 [Candidatus Eisenbacteria bacterium]|uniref:Peptidase M14 domain-containing protein n=1 Tax=Eiseniibacteriota bacterium TaxID=2212470 RepID=A0A7V2AT91_UNCEI|nr:hypothetical protein [Candidatus Eisenbacteria bacterium]